MSLFEFFHEKRNNMDGFEDQNIFKNPLHLMKYLHFFLTKMQKWCFRVRPTLFSGNSALACNYKDERGEYINFPIIFLFPLQACECFLCYSALYWQVKGISLTVDILLYAIYDERYSLEWNQTRYWNGCQTLFSRRENNVRLRDFPQCMEQRGKTVIC